MMRILCVYATRQIDSNLFMSSTVFNGLMQAGYHVDMAFWGYPSVCKVFEQRYSKYFNNVYYQEVYESWIKQQMSKGDRTSVLYSFYRSFLADFIKRPYRMSGYAECLDNNYDVVLSFIPPAVSGYLAHDIHKKICKSAKLIQFWTDPLSLGRCNSISDIPATRKLHILIEKQLLSYADKVVFCYPLLCEKEQELHPQYADKMTWSDVGYTEHLGEESCLRNHSKISIGLFGSYHSKVRNILPYIEAIRAFPDVSFIIRGDSDLTIESSGLDNLDIAYGRRPISEIERQEAGCDILVCLGGSSGITHPAGKVFYYANYDKPIVYIGDGFHNEYFMNYLKGFGRYIVCNNTVEEIKLGIQSAIESLSGFKLHIPERLEPKVIAKKIVE